MRTNYCPHCGSDRIHKVDEEDGSHFHECDDCHEAWRHYDSDGTEKPIVGSHDF